MKTVVFDLDGTLADTSADLISAANFCFDSLGYPKLLDCKEDAGVAMRGGRAMLELGCQKIGLNDEQFIHQQYPILLNAYSKSLDKHTEFFPYALDSIRQLQLLGCKLCYLHEQTVCFGRRVDGAVGGKTFVPRVNWIGYPFI